MNNLNELIKSTMTQFLKEEKTDIKINDDLINNFLKNINLEEMFKNMNLNEKTEDISDKVDKGDNEDNENKGDNLDDSELLCKECDSEDNDSTSSDSFDYSSSE